MIPNKKERKKEKSIIENKAFNVRPNWRVEIQHYFTYANSHSHHLTCG